MTVEVVLFLGDVGVVLFLGDTWELFTLLEKGELWPGDLCEIYSSKCLLV